MDTPIELREQQPCAVLLTATEAQELRELKFDVILAQSVEFDKTDDAIEPAARAYLVNSGCQVGHFRLQSQSQRTVRIQPKVGIRNVFALLAEAYAFYSDGESPFRRHTVDYNVDKATLLEPLVQHFNDKVRVLLQEGLLVNYVEQEENLKVLRGRLTFSRHLARNLVRSDRLYCRFFQSEVDIPENQVILWTLFLLSRAGKWSPEVRRGLRSHILHFGGVSVRQFPPRQCPVFHYDRLSSRYREVHSWCRLFIDLLSISDSVGERTFYGYVLDMNLLFERFVTSMFERAEETVPLVSVQYHTDYNLTMDGAIRICPDLTLNGPNRSTVALDVKYKRTAASGLAKHPDLYQVIAYCTALGLTGQENTPAQGILVYPLSERTPELEGVLQVITTKAPSSGIAIRTMWLDLERDDVIGEATKRCIHVLKEITAYTNADG